MWRLQHGSLSQHAGVGLQRRSNRKPFLVFFKLQTRGLTPLCAPAPLLCDYQSLRYKSNNSTKRWTPGIIYFLPTGWRSHYWIAIQTHVKWISNPRQQVWWSPPVPMQHRCYPKIRVFISQRCPKFMFFWCGAMLIWDFWGAPHRPYCSEAICSGQPRLPCASATFCEMAWNTSQTCFCVYALYPCSSLHPQSNLISLWHGLNFPLDGTFAPRHSSTLRLS